MKVYVVLYDRPIGYDDYYETEILSIFKYEQDAIEYANAYNAYKIEEWIVR